MQSVTRIAVLITCFNRKELTLKCLAALYAGAGNDVRLGVFLVDDGSTDGTGEAVAVSFPDVNIIRGAGNLYWNRGMHLAWQRAFEAPCDYFLWLNDDTELYPGAIDRLIGSAKRLSDKAVIVGRIEDRSTGAVIYGGQSYEERSAKLIGGLRLRYRSIVLVTDDREYCDTLNGNCVLIPRDVAEVVGIHDPVFWHATGDTDYGLRVRAKGFQVAQLLEPIAAGEYNFEYQRKVTVLTPRNWKYIFFHPKGRRLAEQIHFYRLYARPMWLLRLIFSYVKMLRLR